MEQSGEIPKVDENADNTIPVTKEQIDSLRKCITDKIASYRSKRTRNKRGAIAVQSLSILFSFGTTVLIGWKFVAGPQETASDTSTEVSTLTNFALVVSALATGINTLDKVFDYRALWVGYNVSIAKLKSALAKLDYLASPGPDRIKQLQLDEIFKLYEIACADMDKNYQDIRSAREE